MQLHFLGANRQVTGSRYVLDAGGLRILIDCGMFQERPFLERNWECGPVDPATIDVMLLTHAHLDHSGRIPKMVKEGFKGRILATPPSIDLARVILSDSARIQEEDAAQKRRRHRREKRTGPHPVAPLYTARDAEDSFLLFEPIEYDRARPLNDNVTVRYHEAGHILGSAMIEVIVQEDGEARRLVFSGDIGQWDQPLSRNPTLLAETDYLVCESTYGDREHKSDEEFGQDVPAALESIINDTVKRGGNVVIPTFAVDRAQDLLYHVGRLIRAERIPHLMVFLDSPMAINATEIYKRYSFYMDEETQRMLHSDEHPFAFPGLQFTRASHQSRAINNIRGSCVILASSGMCTGGRIKHHLRHNISRPESTIVFTGYQANGTLGRHILNRPEEVRIHGRKYRVKARLNRLYGLSAHADRDDLMRWLGNFSPAPSRLFLTHGDEDAMMKFKSHIEETLGWNVTAPEYGDVVELT